jgi:hypothetical protein
MGELAQLPLAHALDHLPRGALEALLRALAAICCFFDLAGMVTSCPAADLRARLRAAPSARKMCARVKGSRRTVAAARAAGARL